MNKGLLFVIVLALIYWAIYFTSKPERTGRQERENDPALETARDSMREAKVQLLETTVEIFRQAEDRNPQNLQELVKAGYIDKIPNIQGEPFEYNPDTGRVK